MNSFSTIWSLSSYKTIYKKNPNAKYAVKAEISMKTISFNDSAKRSAFSAG